MPEGRTRFGQRRAALGPDILAPELDEAKILRRLREDDPTRGIGEALLDQRNVAGIGNIWKSEGCFMAGIDPWRRLHDVTNEEVVAILRAGRPGMQRSAERGGPVVTYDDAGYWERGTWVFERAGLPCRRCETKIEARGQGD